MRKMAKILNLVLLIWIFVHSVHTEDGYCPKVKLMQNFRPEQYVGTWYEVQRYPTFYQDETKCNVAEYTLNPDGTFGVYNKAILESIDEPISLRGKAIPSANNAANLTVKFDKIPVSIKYWVLETDYKNYSLVYACQQAKDEPIRVEFGWIMSRKPKLSLETISDLVKTLETLGSNVANIEITDHDDCDYSAHDD